MNIRDTGIAPGLKYQSTVDKIQLRAAKRVFGDHITKTVIATLGTHSRYKSHFLVHTLFGVTYLCTTVNSIVALHYKFTRRLGNIHYKIINPEDLNHEDRKEGSTE